MARTRDELRDLIAVLKELHAETSGALQTDLENASRAISKIASGKASGFEELVAAFRSIKSEAKGLQDINPEGIYKVNKALADTIALTKDLARAQEALNALPAAAGRQLRGLETPYVPPSVKARMAAEEEAAFRQANPDVFNPLVISPESKRMQRATERMPQYQEMVQAEEAASSAKVKAEKEAATKLQQQADQLDALAEANRAYADATKKAAEARTQEAIEATQQGLLQAEITKRKAEIAAQQAKDVQLKAEGEMYYANPRTAAIGIDRSSYGDIQASAEATRQGEEAARQKEIAEKEAVADLQQQKLLQQEITRLQEQAADIKQQPLLDAEIAKRRAELNPPITPPTELNPQGGALAAFGGDTTKLDAFAQRLNKIGFELNDINRISRDAATGMTTMTASFTDANGVLQQATIHVDRFGQVVQTQSNNFKTFGDVLANNVKKVLEWTVAIGLVYGAISKLQEVFTNMSELQTLLNDLTITASLSGKALQDTFGQVVDISNKVGLSAVDSLKAMNYALKITGGEAQGAERTAKALDLLTASLTLSKLANIEQNEAMDSLVAALEQSGQRIDQAIPLLDKFQAVAKTSGGSIHDMANTFGITAAAAGDVGVGIDQLTGLIGAFAAATTKSAEETGNSLKVMFSNFQGANAEKVLGQYGIAIKDFVTGDVRPFLDVMTEVSNKINAGLIDDRGRSAIANAVGGGGRRAADVTALLQVLGKANELTLVSQKASGDASAALATKSQTLESAIKVLNNSFLEISNTLGESGGFIELMTTVVKILDGVVQGVNGVVKALGPMTTVLAGMAAIGIGNKLFGNQIREFGAGLFSGGFGSGNRGIQLRTLDNSGQEIAGAVSGGLKSSIKGFMGAFTPALGISIAEAMQGNYAEAGASALGGMIVAGMSGSPLLAGLAAALAAMIVSQIKYIADQNQKAQSALSSGIQNYQEYKKLNPEATPEKWREEMMTRTQNMVSGQQFGTVADKLITGFDNAQMAQIAIRQKEFLDKTNPDLLKSLMQAEKTNNIPEYDRLKEVMNNLLTKNNLGITQQPGANQNFITNSASFNQLAITARNFDFLDTVSKGLTESFKELADVTDAATKIEQDNQYAQQKAFSQAFSGRGTTDLNKLRNDLLMQMGQPGSQITTESAYKNTLEQGGVAQIRTPQVLAALHPEVTRAEDAAKFGKEFDNIFEILSRANTERADFIGRISTEIITLNDAISSGKSTNVAKDREELEINKMLLQTQLQIADVEAARSQIVYPGFTDYRDMSKKEVLKAAGDASRVQKYVVGEMGIDPNEFQKTLDDIYVLTKDGLIKIKGLSKDFFSPAIDGIKEMKKQMEDSFNFQNLRDYPIDVSNRLQKAMNYYQNLLKQWGLNEKIEKFTFLFKDNQVAQLVGSQTALQLALQDLTQVEKKQLDGIYNLPSGATAFIPLQAGQMLSNYTQNQQVGAPPFDYGNFPTPPLTALQSPLDQIVMNTSQANNILAAGFAGLKSLAGSPDNKVPFAASKKFAEQWGDKPWYEKYGVPKADRSYDDIEDVRARGRTASLGRTQEELNVLRGFQRLFSTPGLDVQKMGGTNASPRIDIQVKPEKVTNELNANIVLRVDGRPLATVLKKYLFEDYQRLTASVGRNARSTTGAV